MAKKGSKAGGKLGDLAESLGTLLGTAERRASELLQRGQALAAPSERKKSKPRVRKPSRQRKASDKHAPVRRPRRKAKGTRKTTRKSRSA